MNKAVLTIATGKNVYLDMAANLARSFRWWNRDNGIAFYLATDLPEHLPEDVESYIKIIALKPDELGKGFSTKLHLDKLAPGGQTLFIDADCLIYGNLLPVFEKFKGHPVSVVGGYMSSGDWFGDIAAVCTQFNIKQLPKFNGGIYYIEKGAEATQVYETARRLEPRYDEIGFMRLRGRPNDEVLMAVAMQLHGQTPIADDGSILGDPQACRYRCATNVISGERELINPPPPHPLHQNWYPHYKVSPLVVHFLGSYTHNYPYLKDAYRLQQALNGKLNLITELKALLTIQYPQQLSALAKTVFRPVYHKLFGHRKIKPSERIV